MSRAALVLLLAATSVLTAPSSYAHATVLVIGDSLEVGTGPFLRQELRGVALTVDARTGRPSPEGLEVLRSRLLPSHSVVVFDVGVNNDPSLPQILAGDLEAARESAGDRCLVVASMARPIHRGVSIDAANDVVRSFAAATPGVQLVDWEAAVGADPGLLSPDGTHATQEGYAVRARLVAAAVQACLAGTPPADATGLPAPRSRPRVPPRTPPPAYPQTESGPPSLSGLPGYAFLAGCLEAGKALAESVAHSVRAVAARRPEEPVLGAPDRRPRPGRR